MTMIAFNVTAHGADILTDTLAYTRNGRSLGRTSKVRLLPHADTAVLSQGSGDLGQAWVHALGALDRADDFDDLDEGAQQQLPRLWALLNEQRHGGEVDSIVFHLGYSPTSGGFRAYAYPSIDDFARLDVTGFYAMPAPFTELGDAPATVTEWVSLAQRIREERAMAPVGQGKVFVGADVLHTRLERGSSTTRKVHTFDDTGEELLRMVHGTMHPLFQLSPCPCGSGATVADCHAMPGGDPCNCGSGRTFAACCQVPGPAARVTANAPRW